MHQATCRRMHQECSCSLGIQQGQREVQQYYSGSYAKPLITCVLLLWGCGSCDVRRERAACLHRWSLEGGLGWHCVPCPCA